MNTYVFVIETLLASVYQQLRCANVDLFEFASPSIMTFSLNYWHMFGLDIQTSFG